MLLYKEMRISTLNCNRITINLISQLIITSNLRLLKLQDAIQMPRNNWITYLFIKIQMSNRLIISKNSAISS